MTDWQTYTDESEIVDLIPDSIIVEMKKGPAKTYPLKDADGRIIGVHLPVKVPMSGYCKRQEYSGQEEIFACCDIGARIGNVTTKTIIRREIKYGGLVIVAGIITGAIALVHYHLELFGVMLAVLGLFSVIGGAIIREIVDHTTAAGVIIKSPSIGVYSLMEATANKFLVNFAESSTMDKFKALYFNEYRKEAAALVRDNHYDPEPYREFNLDDETTHTPLDIAVMEYIDELGAKGCDLVAIETWETIWSLFQAGTNGFAMMPGASGSTAWLYGAETYGSVVAACGKLLNKTFDELIWDTPIALIAFTYVGLAKSNDVKGVGRPYDQADVRRQRILAFIREEKGMLHPWQIDRPLDWPLSDRQKKHPAALAQFKKLQETT